MLFNSFIFIFGFLPLAFLSFYILGRLNQNYAKFALTILSLAFYSWWRPLHLPLLLFSIVFNYLVGGVIQRARAQGRSHSVKAWLIFGITVDVALLGWFKYANFFADNLNALGADITLARIALPLAISFFTFQKIAYLIDSARGEAAPVGFLDFALFAAFFPQLIAGPIVHYKEIIPQLQRTLFGRRARRNLMIGLMIFAIGLFKKTVIADTLSSYANPLFEAASAGRKFNVSAGWLAAITYTLQLYFDFSGYSDMAIGLGRMFGVKLPLNFHSPLRASNIIEYWRRWHMTLQRFILAYIFQPIAVPLNRWAAEREYRGWTSFAICVFAPTIASLFISGFWHGAGWTFIVWGLMHGAYICVNEAWRERQKNIRRKLRKQKIAVPQPQWYHHVLDHVWTLLAVVFANVMFRANSVGDAIEVWSGMVGAGGLNLSDPIPNFGWGLIATIVLGLVLVVLAPNTQQIMRRYDPAYNWSEWKDVGSPVFSWTWRPSTLGLIYGGVVLFFGIIFIQRGQAVFLYFNF